MATYGEALQIKQEMDKWLPMGSPFLQAPIKDKITIYSVVEYGYATLSKLRKGFGYGSIEESEIARWLKEYGPGIYAMKKAILADPQITPEIRNAFVAKQYAAIKGVATPVAKSIEVIATRKAMQPLVLAGLALLGVFLLGRK